MPVFSGNDTRRFGRSNGGGLNHSVTPDTVRLFYEPKNLMLTNGKAWRSMVKLTVPVPEPTSGKISAKNKGFRRAKQLTGVWLSPTMVNNVSLDDFELLQTHPDYAGMIEQGIIRIINPRQVSNPDKDGETVNSASGTTVDYSIRDALEIINKSCDTNFLALSQTAEQANLSLDPDRERVVIQIDKRLTQLSQIIDQRLANNKSSRSMNTRGAGMVA